MDQGKFCPQSVNLSKAVSMAMLRNNATVLEWGASQFQIQIQSAV